MEFKNDLGKPWKYEEGDFTVVRTSMWSPPGCHPVGCGLKLYVDKEGRLDHVEGDENNPITKGRLCVRCLALKDYVYNPSRIVVPLKRDPQFRGQHDKWERISWEEAYETIRDNVVRLVEEHGAECIVGLNGTGRSGGIILNDLVQACLGSPNATTPLSGFACYQPRSVACSGVLGAYYPEIDYAGGLEGTYDNPAYTVPEVIVCWGKMPLASNGDGLWGHAVIDLMKRGAKLICVDPRITWLSTRAEIQLRVRPGTDTALAMAWLHVIINEGLYDHDFVDRWCYGFDEFAQRLNDPEKGMTPEKAAEICEVPVEDIYQAARRYATAKPATIAWGLALDQNQNGNQAGQCIVALMAITGNVDVPGGQIIAEVAAAPVAEAGEAGDAEETKRPTKRMGWDSLAPELQEKLLGYDRYPFFCDNMRQGHPDCTLDAMVTGDPYKVRMVWVQSTNMISGTCGAEPEKWYQGLMNAEFNMATDLFVTPTIEAACDLFLPLSTCPEKDDVNMAHYGGSPIMHGSTNRAIDPGETKGDQQILIDLGRWMQKQHVMDAYEDLHDLLSKTRAARAGVTFEELREEVYHQRGVNYRKYETGLLRPDRKPGFLTPTGRVELWSMTYANNGEDPLPYYQEPAMSPRDPATKDDYPFCLTTGARTYCFFHSEHRQVPVLRELNPNPLVEINPEDAARLGVADGQWVEVSNPLGSAKLKAKVTVAVKPGTVMAQHGWWFPERDDLAEAPNLYGTLDSNVNRLIPNHHNSKLGYGAPYKSSICKIVPLKESYDTDMDLVARKFSIG